MKAPITRRLVDTKPIAMVTFNPRVVRCSECKKKFELLSPQWVYTTVTNGKRHWQCRWKCHQIAYAKAHPKRALRGEKVAQQRIDTGKETM